MTKKIIITMVLVGGIFVFTSLGVSADLDNPQEARFEFSERSDQTTDKDQLREEHRESNKQRNLEQRKQKLQLAVDNGCITQEEMDEKMQTRNYQKVK